MRAYFQQQPRRDEFLTRSYKRQIYPGMHDFARNAQHNKRNKQNKKHKTVVPKWLIPLTLLLLAGLVFGLYTLTSVKPEVAAKPIPAPSKKAAPIPKKPRPLAEEEYDFYSMLPKSEVIAPRVEAYSTKKADAAIENYIYLLQAGSFRSAAEADKLRAKLLLEGLSVTTSKVTNENDSVWHRVMVGPFGTRSKLNRAQDILAKANTESMLVRIKQ